MKTESYYIITAIRRSDKQLVAYTPSQILHQFCPKYVDNLSEAKHFQTEQGAREEFEKATKGSASRKTIERPFRIYKVSNALTPMPRDRRVSAKGRGKGIPHIRGGRGKLDKPIIIIDDDREKEIKETEI